MCWVFKTCSCGDDRGGGIYNPDHGILGKQGSDRSYRDEVESGTDFAVCMILLRKVKMNPIWVMILAGVMKVGISLI